MQACESPLLVAVAAGAVALPALLKLSGILSAQGQDITRVEQLPVELALGKVRTSRFLPLYPKFKGRTSPGCSSFRWSRCRARCALSEFTPQTLTFVMPLDWAQS